MTTNTTKPADSQATQDMLDMLGWHHPYERPEHGDEFKAMTDRFLNHATDFQQPLPVPDQAAIVWRGHLLQWRFELAHLRAVFKNYRSVHNRAVKAEARATAAEAKLIDIRAGIEKLAERMYEILPAFPEDAPDDSHELWAIKRGLSALLQPQAQPDTSGLPG